MKFIVTQELGRLAKWLRILGYDTAYFKESKSGSLIIQALREDRIILTRNQHLPKSAGLKIILITGERPPQQIGQLLKQLKAPLNCDMMFKRCVLCNTCLRRIDKAQVKARVPEYVFDTQESFWTCPGCRRIYWLGTHWGNVQKALKEIGS